jgi:hypothetical protein
MPYALIAQVEFGPDDDPAAGRKMLQEGLIPMAKALPGFQSGVWSRALDGRTGIGTIMFDTEANATAGKASLDAQRPPQAPKIVRDGIYEVQVTA